MVDEHAKQRNVRARMAITGKSYTAALRALDDQPQPSVARADFTDPYYLTITASQLPHQRTIVHRTPTRGCLPNERAHLWLDQLLGWRRSRAPSGRARRRRWKPQSSWPSKARPTTPRSRSGGKPGSPAPPPTGPYIWAVIDAIEREGITVTDGDSDDIDPP